MLGISSEAVWIAGALLLILLLGTVGLMLFAPDSAPVKFGQGLFRTMWYDFMYFMFGPRMVEV